MRPLITATLAILATAALGGMSILPQIETEDGPTIDLTTVALIIVAFLSWTGTLAGIWWLALSL